MKTTALMAAMVAGMILPAVDAQAQGPRDRPDFATLDANGDGSVTMEELAAQGAARFATADANGDGLLSPSELTTQIEARAESRAADMVERMLDRLDANNDGNISQDELPDRGERMFERADANDDGAISEEEFEQITRDRGNGQRRGHGNRDGQGHRDRG